MNMTTLLQMHAAGIKMRAGGPGSGRHPGDGASTDDSEGKYINKDADNVLAVHDYHPNYRKSNKDTTQYDHPSGASVAVFRSPKDGSRQWRTYYKSGMEGQGAGRGIASLKTHMDKHANDYIPDSYKK